MDKYKEIKPYDFDENIFKRIGKDWMLITAASNGKVNTMTAAWGGLGVLFNKNVAYIFVRPQRYTKQFVDDASTFSLTFFDDSYKEQLSYLGTVSGKDEDKITKSNLTTVYMNETPYFEQSRITMICRKLYAQDMNEQSFIDTSTRDKCYPDKDYHTLYIAEIEKIIIKE